MNKTLKLFLQFGAIFIILYFFLDFLTFAYVKSTYKPINDYEIEINSPKIEITEAKATYINGYVKGKVNNNTGEDMDNLYVKINFYSERDVDLGTRFAKIENLKKGESKEFEIKFKYQDVKSFKVNVTNEAVIEEGKDLQIFDGFTSIAVIFASLIFIRYFL